MSTTDRRTTTALTETFPRLEMGDAAAPRRTARVIALLRRARIQSLGMLAFLVILSGFAIAVYPGFAAPTNLRNILSQNAPIGLIAIGMTFVMIGGGFDLSVGSMVALVAVVFAKLSLAAPLPVALAVSLGVGVVLGGVNSVLVARLGLNPFIATLATASIFSGTAYVISESQPIVVTGVDGFQQLGQGLVFGIPISVALLTAAMLVGGLVLKFSVYGHLLYAVGGNREAARLAGVRTRAVQGASYVVMGLMSAGAAIVLTSRLSVGQADLGADFTLNAITIVVIGGTSLFGGEGAMWRTAVGLLLIGIISNVADSKGWSGSIQDIVKGSILLFAIGLDLFSRRARSPRNPSHRERTRTGSLLTVKRGS